MRMQSSQANCGSTSLYNALRAVGTKLSMEACERVCNTSATDGTSIYSLIDAIATIKDCNPIVLSKKCPNNIFILGHNLILGRPSILCVDEGDHYVAIIGLLGKRVIVADSASNELVESWTEHKLIKRWAPDYWGVII